MRLRNRRGAVLVLAAFLMVAVLASLVIVVDFSRIYVDKTELQTVADAAALAGVMELSEGAPEDMIQDSAAFYGEKNKVENKAINIAAADIKCGVHDLIAETYVGPSIGCGFYDNAVTVTVKAPARYSLVSMFSANPYVYATARAFSAYVGASKCIKPWAIPYVKLTKVLQPSNLDTLRDIDSTDAANLRSMTEEERTFMLKIGAPPDGGNFGALEIPSNDPDAPNGGGNLYKYNITYCNPTLIGPGDTLMTEPGNMKTPTTSSIADWCNLHGSFVPTSGGGGNCFDPDGNPGVVVKAALWSAATEKNGRFAVIVRQIVSFVLESTSKDAEVTGHFLPYLTIGEVTPAPTTVKKPILVKY